MKRVLILGATGLLGHRLFMDLGKEFQVIGSVRQLSPKMSDLFSQFPGEIRTGVDVLMPGQLEKLVSDTRPDVVINAVGLVKQQKSTPTHMIELNAWLPWKIQQILEEKGGRLIHVSTDCVFRGDRGDYHETDLPDAQDIYGRSKALGEILDQPNVLTLRTSIIGRELQNHMSLVDWFMGRPQGETVKGFQGAVYSGFPTHSLAKVLRDLIKLAPQLSGLYHLSSDPINKYDLLRRIRDRLGKDVSIEPVAEPKINRSLNADALRSQVSFAIPRNWDELIDDLFIDFDRYDEWSN